MTIATWKYILFLNTGDGVLAGGRDAVEAAVADDLEVCEGRLACLVFLF